MNNIPAYSPVFCANLNSPKLRFKRDDFFVNIRGYGKNPDWADEMIKSADSAVSLIRRDTSAENVLKIITFGVSAANNLLCDMEKKFHTGLLRTEISGWRRPSNWKYFALCTNYSSVSRYKSYQKRLDYRINNPLTNPYTDFELTRPVADKQSNYLNHGGNEYIANALKMIFKLYSELKKSFNPETINQDQLQDVNEKIAEMRWILAHATPWERGSDAISNVFMRAMYKSLGVKTYPLERGISLDMEAYCTELADYKTRFVSYFEKKPEIID